MSPLTLKQLQTILHFGGICGHYREDLKAVCRNHWLHNAQGQPHGPWVPVELIYRLGWDKARYQSLPSPGE